MKTKNFLAALTAASMLMSTAQPMTSVAFAEETGIAIDETNFPDAIFREFVSDVYFDTDLNGVLSDEEISDVFTIEIPGRGISDLTGIEHFTSLLHLDCSNNKLTELDVSSFPDLDMLECQSNYLTSIDISHNPKLQELNVSNNCLTSISVPYELDDFYCSNNIYTLKGYCLDELTEKGFDPNKVISWENAEYDAETNSLINLNGTRASYMYDTGYSEEKFSIDIVDKIIPGNPVLMEMSEKYYLVWNLINNINQYGIFVSTDNVNFTHYADAFQCPEFVINLSDLEYGYTYYWQVRSFMNGKYQEPTPAVSFMYKKFKAMFVKAVSSNGILDLTWVGAEDATGYYVTLYDEKGEIGYSNYIQGRVTKYRITDLEPNIRYGVVLRPVRGSQEGEDSDIVYFTTSAINIPQNIVTTAGDKKVRVVWDATEGAGKYRVVYRTEDQQEPSYSEDITTPEYIVNGLTNNTSYIFGVQSYNGYAWSDLSDVSTAAPVDIDVNNVTATAGNKSVKVTWQSFGVDESYRVYVYENGEVKDYFDTTEASYTVTDLTNGTEYGFAVEAFLNGMYTCHEEADIVYAQPVNDIIVENVEAVAGDCEVTITWDEAEYATKYAVYMVDEDISVCLDDEITDTSYTVTELTNGTEYGFYVMAFADEWSEASETVYATPKLLTVPQNVEAVAGNKKVTITWDEVENATKYAVYIYIDGKYTCLDSNITDTSYTATGLTNDTKYGFKVKAYVGKWRAASDMVYATPVFNIVPQNVKAAAGIGEATITWNAVDDAARYAVYKYIDGEYICVDSQIKATSYTVKDLTNYTKYGFKVKAYVDGTWSAASSMAYATPIGNIVPQNIRTVSGDTYIVLRWDAVEGAERYRVYKYIDGEYTIVDSYVDSTDLAVGNLINGTKYGFKIKAYVNGIWSAASEMVWVTPLGNIVPQNVKAEAGNGEATVTWDAVAGAQRYAVYIYVDGKYTCLDSNIITTSYTAADLTNGTKYGFKVKAYAGGKWSAASAIAYATPLGNIVPQNVNATAGDGEATVTWDAVAGAQRYAVYIYVDGEYTCLDSNIKMTSYTAADLTNGTRYGFKVKAYAGGKWSAASAIAYAELEI